MKKFEYKVLVEPLNSLGDVGWEVIVATRNNDTREWHIILKRIIKNLNK